MSGPEPPAEQPRTRNGVTVAHALRSTTRAAIFEHLQEHDGEAGVTVRDIAGEFDLHPNVARTHLELLADAGLVEVGRRKHPGGGRPAKVYQAKDDADEVIAEEQKPSAPTQSPEPGAALLVRLMAAMIEERPAPAFGRIPTLIARAHEIAVTEGRHLVEDLSEQRRSEVAAQSDSATDRLSVAAQLAVEALR